MQIAVTDPRSPLLADYAGLRDRDLLRRGEGLFVGEQLLVVERMLALPGVTRSVLCAESFVDRVAPLVADDVPLYVAPTSLLEAVAGFHVHRGVLAVGRRDRVPQPTPQELAGDSGAARTILACEEITHADNMGALFRVAAAMGVHGVLLSPGCHDPLYRRCVRVSIGTVLTVPWAWASEWPAALETLRARHDLKVIGTALRADSRPIAALDRPRRAVVAVGTEFAGLSPAALACCDAVARIPMAEGVDSLNVAVAAAIALDRLGSGERM